LVAIAVRRFNRSALTAVLSGALLVWMVSLVQPPALLVTLGEQQTVRTRNDLAGVHTRFVDEAEAWKIKRGLEMTREMGARWIVEFFPWPYYEPRKGSYDWAAADRIVDHANRQGLTVIARLGFVPEWARPREVDGVPTTVTYLDAAGSAHFAEFAAAFAAHFRGKVRHFVILNEPNLNFEWGLRRVDPAGYVDVLKAVYPAIKRAQPEAIVLAGALAPTVEINPDVALNDLTYLKAMYAAGAKPYFDALAIHNYGQTLPPGAPAAPDVVNFRRAELLRAIMVDNGDAIKDAYITETGWNDDPRFVNGVTPANRVRYTLDALALAKAEWPWVKCVAIWVFKLPAPANGYRDAFTLVTPSLEPLPVYEAIREGLIEQN
jgi:polysaccharide biosynthesis protein PslG